MGYLQELQEELREMLGEIDEAKQKEIVQFVGKKVYESWKNGKEQGQAEARLGRAGAGLEEAGKRFAGKRQRT